MNNENLAFLQDSLKYLGFGESNHLQDQLELQLERGPKDFQLFTEAYYEDDCKVEAALYFRKGEKIDMYFFNKYEALLRNTAEPDLNRRQVFYINRGKGITFKEAYNLLQSRAVYKELTNKEGEKYMAWLQIDFEQKTDHGNHRVRQYGTRYGYNLDDALNVYPIVELGMPETKSTLVSSLKKGNLHMVHFRKPHKIVRMMIAANPQYKSLNIYPFPLAAGSKPGKKKDPFPLQPVPEDPGEQLAEVWEDEEIGDAEEIDVDEIRPAVSKPAVRKKSRA